MSIKFAARGISEQFRTPSELVETDGVCLKPTDGGEVFVGSSTAVQFATDYDADTGGCTVDGETYADTAALNAAGLYVLSDAVTAWDVSGASVAKSGVGVADVWVDEALELVLGLRCNTGGTSWRDVTFGSNDYWYSGLTSAEQKTAAETFGCSTAESNNSYWGAIGCLMYEPDSFNYTPLALMADETTATITDMTNISCDGVGAGRATGTYLGIKTTGRSITDACKFWKVRITKK